MPIVDLLPMVQEMRRRGVRIDQDAANRLTIFSPANSQRVKGVSD